MLKKILLVTVSIMSVLIIGCSNTDETQKEEVSYENSTEDNFDKTEDDSFKVSVEDSLGEIEEKLFNATLFNQGNKPIKTMEEAIEYAKEILPDGAEEIDREYSEKYGATYINYEVENIIFYTCYMHPYTPGENPENYDLSSIVGITFPKVEINVEFD